MGAMQQEHGSSAPGDDALAVAHGLSFVELMELLEFSCLRLEAPAPGDNAALIGTQEWRRTLDGSALEPSCVYICSTLAALKHAVLPPADAELRIDIPSSGQVRLMATMRRRPAAPPPRRLRVDLQTLIRRVMVPAKAPASLYELVRHVVQGRLWVEVARI